MEAFMEQGSTFSKVTTALLMLMVAGAVLVGADVLAGHWFDNSATASGVAVVLRLAALFVAGDSLVMIGKVIAVRLQPLRRRRDGTHRAAYGRIVRAVR
jgi:hypothetical protein